MNLAKVVEVMLELLVFGAHEAEGVAGREMDLSGLQIPF